MNQQLEGSAEKELNYGDAVAHYLLDLAEKALAVSSVEDCLRYSHVAATVLSRQNRFLFSPRIERLTREISGRLFESEPVAVNSPKAVVARPTVLHVLSEALPAGGLTAMATRWIAADSTETRSCVALLTADSPPPRRLVDAVVLGSGRIYVARVGSSFVDQARWLRHLASEIADYVVLHIDTSDVVCGAAFNHPGGPPVLLVNHNAHVFWTGVSYADRIINCRGSELETAWTTTLRQTSRVCFVPIPLDLPNSEPTPIEGSYRQRDVRAWRSAAGIPESAVVIVTVGARFKYSSLPKYDFVEIIRWLLASEESAYLVVVGFSPDERWNRVIQSTNGRVKLLGTLSHHQVLDVYSASDIYIEGFPFGTTTALLEAACSGLAVALAPSDCPPPYSTDGAAVDDILPRLRLEDDYKQHLLGLVRNRAERDEIARKVQSSVRRHHTGNGWTSHVREALNDLPTFHRTYSCHSAPPRTPRAIYEHWTIFVPVCSWPFSESLEHALVRALLLGLKPRIDLAAARVLSSVGQRLRSRPMPIGVAWVLCNMLLPLLPARSRVIVFRVVSFVARPHLFRRLRHKVERVSKGEPPNGAYAEYRTQENATPSDAT